MARRNYDWWCCLCGARDPDPQEICPVSDYEMRGHGLKHLVASGIYKRAIDIWDGAAESRAALKIQREAPVA